MCDELYSSISLGDGDVITVVGQTINKLFVDLDLIKVEPFQDVGVR